MPRDALIDNLIGMCAFVGRAQEFPCGQTVRVRAEYCTVCEAAERLGEQAQAPTLPCDGGSLNGPSRLGASRESDTGGEIARQSEQAQALITAVGDVVGLTGMFGGTRFTVSVPMEMWTRLGEAYEKARAASPRERGEPTQREKDYFTMGQVAEQIKAARERGEQAAAPNADRSEPIAQADGNRLEPMRRDLARLLDNLFGLHFRPGHLDAVMDVIHLHAPTKQALIPERDDER